MESSSSVVNGSQVEPLNFLRAHQRYREMQLNKLTEIYSYFSNNERYDPQYEGKQAVHRIFHQSSRLPQNRVLQPSNRPSSITIRQGVRQRHHQTVNPGDFRRV